MCVPLWGGITSPLLRATFQNWTGQTTQRTQRSEPKRPSRISVAMPPDDWHCQKLEHLNTTVAEGYPSRAQDSAGLNATILLR